MRVECEKPVLAGVNGVAVGLGLSLAMNADIRIAAPSARFHPGYARVGTSPDGGLTWTLTRAVGYERAMRFLLEQRMVSAPEAHALGLVSEIAETDDAFEQRFLDYGQMLAGVAPLAARQTKRLLVRVDSPPDLATHLDDEISLALHGLAVRRQQRSRSSDRLQGTARVHRSLDERRSTRVSTSGAADRTLSANDWLRPAPVEYRSAGVRCRECAVRVFRRARQR